MTLAGLPATSIIGPASGVSTGAGVVTFSVTSNTVDNVTYTATDTAQVNFTAPP